MVVFYDYSEERGQRFRTFNPVEAPIASFEAGDGRSEPLSTVDRAIAVIWKMPVVA